MTEIEHEYCDHGICRKCDPCGACEGEEAGKRIVAKLLKELAVPQEKDNG